MDKTNQKKQDKQAKPTKKSKQQPLKVVYFTNPIKLKASSVSEFKALVQEHTGQDAHLSESGSSFFGGGGSKMAAEEGSHAPQVAAELGPSSTSGKGSSSQTPPSSFGSLGGDFYDPKMVDEFDEELLWQGNSDFDDVFKSM